MLICKYICIKNTNLKKNMYTYIYIYNYMYIIFSTFQVDENMKRAQYRDAVNTQTFYFRKILAPLDKEADPQAAADSSSYSYTECLP